LVPAISNYEALRELEMRRALSQIVRQPTADPKALDGDVILAAQAISLGFPPSQFIIATTNPGHITRYAPADLWTNIRP